MKIYTRTGDQGQTSLYGGERRAKSDIRIAAFGDVDELQAELGLAITQLEAVGMTDITAVLQEIQFDGFVLCAELARTTTKVTRKDPSITEDRVAWLEGHIDQFETELSPLTHFIVQGGSLPGAQLHVTRAVCRRAERGVVRLSGEEEVSPLCYQYLNRLSDLLFVLARVANHRLGQPEVPWVR